MIQSTVGDARSGTERVELLSDYGQHVLRYLRLKTHDSMVFALVNHCICSTTVNHCICSSVCGSIGAIYYCEWTAQHASSRDGDRTVGAAGTGTALSEQQGRGPHCRSSRVRVVDHESSEAEREHDTRENPTCRQSAAFWSETVRLRE